MKEPSLLVQKSFLNRCGEAVASELISLLPPNTQNVLAHLPTPAPFKKELLSWDLLSHIHFSWLSPFLRTLSKNDVVLFLSALEKEKQEGLSQILGFKNGEKKLSSFSKRALRKFFVEQLTKNQSLIPLAFLPEFPLNFLLSLESQTLIKLIRFLGLHDLSFEMRQIISTKEIKVIFTALDKKEAEYLNHLTLQVEPLIFKRLFLKDWDGTREQMKKLLIDRGMQRLGIAIHGAEESFEWYLTHRLEMHMGGLLHKYKEKPTRPKTLKILHTQIAKILKFLGESS